MFACAAIYDLYTACSLNVKYAYNAHYLQDACLRSTVFMFHRVFNPPCLALTLTLEHGRGGLKTRWNIQPSSQKWNIIMIIIIYPLTAKVVGAPQMISQPVSPWKLKIHMAE